MRRLPLFPAVIALTLQCAGACAALAQEALPFELAELRIAGLLQDTEGRSKIYGGKTVVPSDKYPFQVALIHSAAPSGQEWRGQFCGGSLIADRWVLTAAHCMFRRDRVTQEKIPIGPKDLDIYAGSANFAGGDRIRSTRLIVHRDYKVTSHRNDIALVELERSPARGWKSAAIDYAAVAADRSLADADHAVTVIGWGEAEDGSYPKGLREVDLLIAPNNVCDQAVRDRLIKRAIDKLDAMADELEMGESEYQAALAAIMSTKSGVDATMLCAGHEEGGKDSCQGDSGGPLFTRTANGYAQVGIVSWGLGCGLPKVRGLYTRLSEFKPWIDQTIGASQ
jgi:secreted trypsin-like serine protease